MTTRISFFTVLFILFSATLISCAGARVDKAYVFDRTLRSYNNLLQSKDLESASNLVHPSIHQRFYEEGQKLVDNTNISTIKIRSVTMDKSGDKAIVVIVRDIFDNQTYEVRQVTVTQTWEKSGLGASSWRLVDGEF